LTFILLIAALSAAPAPEQCDTGGTIGMAQCMDRKIGQAKSRLNQYRARAVQRFEAAPDRDPATVKAIEDAGVAADAYRETYCGAVYQRWIEGSIRFAMDQECKLRLIDRETHDIWSDFLRFIQEDATPLLPEPKPTKF
jgi:uncharacterized protein YecT (DUF1311 family)